MTATASSSSQALFDALAPDYDSHFEVPHRRAYDDLAWERVARLLPPAPALIVDVGCGTGRWAPRLAGLGHSVLGIEPAPAMAAAARLRAAELGSRFRVTEESIESAELSEGCAGAVLAMGSLQYAENPATSLKTMSAWLRPGGVAVVLVDSLVALVIELLARGEFDEAMERLTTRRGVWRSGEQEAGLRLFDGRGLTTVFHGAGFVDVTAAGLLVTASTWGREELADRLIRNREAVLVRERELAGHPELADLGKQLMVTGRRPC